jgi:hypothetical protein
MHVNLELSERDDLGQLVKERSEHEHVQSPFLDLYLPESKAPHRRAAWTVNERLSKSISEDVQ